MKPDLHGYTGWLIIDTRPWFGLHSIYGDQVMIYQIPSPFRETSVTRMKDVAGSTKARPR